MYPYSLIKILITLRYYFKKFINSKRVDMKEISKFLKTCKGFYIIMKQ